MATAYFGVVASDVYVSESRFVVRTSEAQTPSTLGLILKGTGLGGGGADAYAVQDFILSRDAARALDKELNIKQTFSANSIDVFSRFSGLGLNDNFEEFQKYYEKKVGVQVDSTSSIVTLTTRAFTAKDAYTINERLVGLAEDLVNRLNQRERTDLIRVAANEVEDAQSRALKAGLALSTYRNEKGVIDPEKQSAIPLQQIAKLQDELLTIRTQIAQFQQFADRNPQLPVLQQRAKMVESEIQRESGKVTGGQQSLAAIDAQYQHLALQKEFADKMLASAMSTLEQARAEAQRKQVYLERVAQPSDPDSPQEPRRLRDIVAVFVLGLVLWGILSILVAGVIEHHDR